MSNVVYMRGAGPDPGASTGPPTPPQPTQGVASAPIGPRPAPQPVRTESAQQEQALKPQRPIEEQAIALLPSEWLFKEEDLPDRNRPIAVGETLVLDTRVNAALRLAHRNQFMSMIAHCLWGDEQTSELVRLGYLARGAVMTLQPTNVFELYLVGNVVSAQWKLDRTMRIQQTVFNSHATKRTAGRHGLPTATWAAMELDEEVFKCQKLLDGAIKSYHLATKRDRTTCNW